MKKSNWNFTKAILGDCGDNPRWYHIVLTILIFGIGGPGAIVMLPTIIIFAVIIADMFK